MDEDRPDNDESPGKDGGKDGGGEAPHDGKEEEESSERRAPFWDHRSSTDSGGVGVALADDGDEDKEAGIGGGETKAASAAKRKTHPAWNPPHDLENDYISNVFGSSKGQSKLLENAQAVLDIAPFSKNASNRIYKAATAPLLVILLAFYNRAVMEYWGADATLSADSEELRSNFAMIRGLVAKKKATPNKGKLVQYFVWIRQFIPSDMDTVIYHAAVQTLSKMTVIDSDRQPWDSWSAHIRAACSNVADDDDEEEDPAEGKKPSDDPPSIMFSDCIQSLVSTLKKKGESERAERAGRAGISSTLRVLINKMENIALSRDL